MNTIIIKFIDKFSKKQTEKYVFTGKKAGEQAEELIKEKYGSVNNEKTNLSD